MEEVCPPSEHERNKHHAFAKLTHAMQRTPPEQAIADETGGKFYEAQDAKALEQIYREIDQLERSEIESLRFMDYKELFLPFAIAAFLLLGLEVALNCTLFRKIP